MRFLSTILRCKPGKPLWLERIESKFLRSNILRTEELLRKEIRENFLKEVDFEMRNGIIFPVGGSGQVKRIGQLYGFVDLSEGLEVGQERVNLGNGK